MHPIFRSGKLGFYLAAWLPVGAALAIWLAVFGGLSWSKSAATALPLCLLYAFICLSSWYGCRSLPLRVSAPSRILITNALSALVVAALWSGLALAILGPLFGATVHRETLLGVYGLGVVLYLLSVAVHYVLIAVEASRAAEAREAEARFLAGEAELRALKAQINPHFLFNSLHSISALTTIDASRAREMCVLLSDFLRSTLGLSDKAAIPLEEELAMIRRYLAIEKIRFGSRLRVEEEMQPECAPYPVPPLLLQPLVENAVVHGIANLVDEGLIRITAAGDGGGGVVLAVENTFDAEAPAKRRGGFGLASVRKRLHVRYGAGAVLDAAAYDGTYRVELRLPAPGGTPV